MGSVEILRRVARQANIWHPREDRASINFRPIFNFSQDALPRHARQPSPPISSPRPFSLSLQRSLLLQRSANLRGVANRTAVSFMLNALALALPFIFDERNLRDPVNLDPLLTHRHAPAR